MTPLLFLLTAAALACLVGYLMQTNHYTFTDLESGETTHILASNAWAARRKYRKIARKSLA